MKAVGSVNSVSSVLAVYVAVLSPISEGILDQSLYLGESMEESLEELEVE